MMKKYIIIATLAFAMASCDKGFDDYVSEYTPDAIGDNAWTAIPEPKPIIPDDDVVPGKVPSDESLAGTLVSRLSAVYSGDLTISINDESTPATTQNIIIRATDGNHINFGLKNFLLADAEIVMPVGTILIKDIEVKEDNENPGNVKFDFQDAIYILPGEEKITVNGVDMEVKPDEWFGPMLGAIPIKISGSGNHESIDIDIDITMEALDQVIHVDFKTSDIPGLSPTDPFFIGSLVSRFQDSYVGDLTVSINEESTEPSKQNVIIKAVDENHINFALKNFLLADDESVMPIGTILLENIEVNENPDGTLSFQFKKDIYIRPGDSSVMLNGEIINIAEEDWLGPFLGPIPVKLTGISDGKKLTIGIDIVMEGLGQTIHVDFIVK